jgi:hypothetical protein
LHVDKLVDHFLFASLTGTQGGGQAVGLTVVGAVVVEAARCALD